MRVRLWAGGLEECALAKGKSRQDAEYVIHRVEPHYLLPR